MLFNTSFCSWSFRFFGFLLGIFGAQSLALAAQITVGWTDNSSNEDGFRIERRIGAGGTYQQLASVGSNITSYTDLNLADNTAYCYRVIAFNTVGSSAYSNENCATTPAAASTLTVSRSGAGTGTVTSAPAGITCGTDCSESYTTGTSVTLIASASAGSVFAGWSGNADCADGTVAVSGAVSCTATFNLASTYMLTTSVVKEMTSQGSADGKVLSNPLGIDCGSDCAQAYAPGQVISLSPVPAANSKFAGWTGDSDCTDGSVTLNANKTCTANFTLNKVTISVAKTGKGKVSGAAADIDCGTSCSTSVTSGSWVALKAVAEPGYVFSGWSGGCSGKGDCNLTATVNTTAVANFTSIGDKIGVYRPSTGEWFLDRNGSGAWEDCGADLCAQLFTGSGALPVVGDWNGSGTAKLGLFNAESSEWFLDANGNGVWDGCTVDICSQSFGSASDLPAVGRWNTAVEDRIAIFRASENKWHLDVNGNEILDKCKTDKCASLSVYSAGDVPVAGDWSGRGTTAVGLFRPSTGQWFLDRNDNRSWNGCTKDLCIAAFGSAGDLPVAGDWNGTGIAKIGVFRPSTGEWFLDLNGNGKWDGPALDIYVAGFGQAGDLPVVGNW